MILASQHAGIPALFQDSVECVYIPELMHLPRLGPSLLEVDCLEPLSRAVEFKIRQPAHVFQKSLFP